MSCHGLGVGVLLVEHDGVRIVLDLVRDIADASGLPAGRLSQLAQRFGDIGAIFLSKLHADRKADHSGTSFRPGSEIARLLNFVYALRLERASAKSGSSIVCSRSGPVETMPMRAPLSRSWKRRYSRAAWGSLSNSMMPSVHSRQPFKVVNTGLIDSRPSTS